IGRILVLHTDEGAAYGYLPRQCRLLHRDAGQGSLDPVARLGAGEEAEPASPCEQEELPDGDRREPQLVPGVRQRCRDTLGEAFGLGVAPYPHVRVEEQIHSSASHFTEPLEGATMSPRISRVPRREPSHSRWGLSAAAGTTSAIGFPKRVTRSGR